jgi:hypothetical protein
MLQNARRGDDMWGDDTLHVHDEQPQSPIVGVPYRVGQRRDGSYALFPGYTTGENLFYTPLSLFHHNDCFILERPSSELRETYSLCNDLRLYLRMYEGEQPSFFTRGDLEVELKVLMNSCYMRLAPEGDQV